MQNFAVTESRKNENPGRAILRSEDDKRSTFERYPGRNGTVRA